MEDEETERIEEMRGVGRKTKKMGRPREIKNEKIIIDKRRVGKWENMTSSKDREREVKKRIEEKGEYVKEKMKMKMNEKWWKTKNKRIDKYTKKIQMKKIGKILVDEETW